MVQWWTGHSYPKLSTDKFQILALSLILAVSLPLLLMPSIDSATHKVSANETQNNTKNYPSWPSNGPQNTADDKTCTSAKLCTRITQYHPCVDDAKTIHNDIHDFA
jgi:hypothetical protein